MSSSRVEIEANYLIASVSHMGILCNTCLEFVLHAKWKFMIFLINFWAGVMGDIRRHHDLINYHNFLWLGHDI